MAPGPNSNELDLAHYRLGRASPCQICPGRGDSIGQIGSVPRSVGCLSFTLFSRQLLSVYLRDPSDVVHMLNSSPVVRIQPRKSRDVEMSADEESWQEVGHKKDNERLNGRCFTDMFAAVDGGEVRFVWWVTIRRNQGDDGTLCFSSGGTIGCVAISRRTGLCQHTTQSARIPLVRAVST
jgi:hypothetical protein